MNTLIIYASKHGCTEKCARILQNHLTEPVDLKPIKQTSVEELEDAHTIIIGGSIHAGRIQKQVKVFSEKHSDLLTGKKLGLYICCMETGDSAQKQFRDAYPQTLRDHASAHGLFGGEFDFDKMNFLEKSIIKKIAGIEKSVSKIDECAIHQFAESINASSTP